MEIKIKLKKRKRNGRIILKFNEILFFILKAVNASNNIKLIRVGVKYIFAINILPEEGTRIRNEIYNKIASLNRIKDRINIDTAKICIIVSIRLIVYLNYILLDLFSYRTF